MQDFVEIEFKMNNGDWGRACFDSDKIDEIIEKLENVTEVRRVLP